MAMITRQYLLDIDADLNYCFVETSAESIGRANFLDRSQLEYDSASEHRISMAKYSSPYTRMPVNFIFHTAFCGSTLLSRALHNPPNIVSLKEPHVLFRLSEASLKLSAESLAPHVHNVMAELSQPWASGGQVIIKPTNSCNRIISNLVMPDDKVLFLYSTLESFLISCLKKMPESETRVDWMARHLLPGSSLERECGIPQKKFNLLEACVLTWYVSLQYFSKAIRSNPEMSYKVLSYHELKDARSKHTNDVATHFQIPDSMQSSTLLESQLSHDSKAAGKTFDLEGHENHSEYIRVTYNDVIQNGLKWATENIQPYANVNPIFLR